MIRTLPARYAKLIAAVAGYGLLFAQIEWDASSRWVLLATSVAASLGVAVIPNTPAKPPPPA